MRDLGAPHNESVIVERGSEKAVAHFVNGVWLIGHPYMTLKEQLDFVPTSWHNIVKD